MSPLLLLLAIELRPADLWVRLQNPTDQPLRVWALANSWGGASWSLRLAAAQRELVLRPTKQPYTANVPRFIEVPANGQAEFMLAPSGLEWTFGKDLSAFLNVPLAVRAVLDIASSREATEQDVAIGRVESAAITSQPPHTWLSA